MREEGREREGERGRGEGGRGGGEREGEGEGGGWGGREKREEGAGREVVLSKHKTSSQPYFPSIQDSP